MLNVYRKSDHASMQGIRFGRESTGVFESLVSTPDIFWRFCQQTSICHQMKWRMLREQIDQPYMIKNTDKRHCGWTQSSRMLFPPSFSTKRRQNWSTTRIMYLVPYPHILFVPMEIFFRGTSPTCFLPCVCANSDWQCVPNVLCGRRCGALLEKKGDTEVGGFFYKNQWGA